MMDVNDKEPAELEELAREIATEAGDLLVQKWFQTRQVDSKGYRDFVTDADYAAAFFDATGEKVN